MSATRLRTPAGAREGCRLYPSFATKVLAQTQSRNSPTTQCNQSSNEHIFDAIIQRGMNLYGFVLFSDFKFSTGPSCGRTLEEGPAIFNLVLSTPV